MSLHVHGNIVTNYGIAANNRGETEGNITTLQKVLWKGELHSSVSAEAIRFAIRYRWQQLFELTGDAYYETNRTWNDSDNRFEWKDQSFAQEGERYIDDDVMGFMDAKAAAAEGTASGEDTEAEKGKKKPRKGTAKVRRGPLEVSRAVSLHPFYGETTFSAKGGEKSSTSLYATEMHATSYQFGFSVTPGALRVPDRIHAILEALVSLGAVGGNQGRFLYDFSPRALIFRVTHDPAPRMLYTINAQGAEALSMSALVHRVNIGDIAGKELIVGGEAALLPEAEQLQALGVTLVPSVRESAKLVRQLAEQ